jgi:hypothetical protein
MLVTPVLIPQMIEGKVAAKEQNKTYLVIFTVLESSLAVILLHHVVFGSFWLTDANLNILTPSQYKSAVKSISGTWELHPYEIMIYGPKIYHESANRKVADRNASLRIRSAVMTSHDLY